MRDRLAWGCLILAAVSCKADPSVTPSVTVAAPCFDPAPPDAAVPVVDSGAIPDSDDGSKPADPALCSGNDEPQFAFGEKPADARLFDEIFPSPRGTYFVVDGRCHYYAFDDNLVGVREGDLSAAQTARLRADLEVDHLSEFTSRPDTCIDGWTSLITSDVAALSCGCAECDGDDRATAALQNGVDRRKRLSAAGMPLTSTLRALALPYKVPADSCFHPVFVPWPLARPMTTVPDLIQPASRPMQAGAFIKDADELVQLRQLRADAATRWLALDSPEDDIYVEDQGVPYRLFLQDLLPADAAAVIDQFLNRR
jgi:hypothetical protein